MRLLMTITIIVAFAGMALFGFFLMTHESMSLHKLCLATIAGSGLCPDEGGGLGMFDFHVEAFSGFVSVVTQSIFALLATIAISIFVIAISVAPSDNSRTSHSNALFEENQTPLFSVQRKILEWLSLVRRGTNIAFVR